MPHLMDEGLQGLFLREGTVYNDFLCIPPVKSVGFSLYRLERDGDRTDFQECILQLFLAAVQIPGQFIGYLRQGFPVCLGDIENMSYLEVRDYPLHSFFLVAAVR